jgi:acyl-CoA reductase-like NAD-dependent aldehyde dehydrogenase
MSNIDDGLVKEIVTRVLLELGHQGPPTPSHAGNEGVFADIDDAITASLRAQPDWAKATLAHKSNVIESLRQAMHKHAEEFAQMAYEETGMGRVEDKIRKHHNAANATPGLEDLASRSWSGDRGLVVEEYAPYGVLAAVTPSTHPIPVLLNSIISIIAPGNGVVFNVHPAAKSTSAYAMNIFSRAIRLAGGPSNLITMVKEPSMESVQRLFSHPALPMIVATGGPALVEAAFAAGKKVIAAGPGNPPAVVDPSACLRKASQHIIEGASFDNNILCIAEKETFVLEPVFEKFMTRMQEAGAVRLTASQIEALSREVFSRGADGEWTVGHDYVGKNASVLAKAVGLSLSDSVRLLYGETRSDHPFVQEEQMMPFMPVVRTRDIDEAIRLAVEAEHGYGHTATIHSSDLDVITRFSKAVDTDIVVVNGPSLAGNGPPAGEGYFSHTISSPTGEGICTPKDFARIRRITTYGSLRIV